MLNSNLTTKVEFSSETPGLLKRKAEIYHVSEELELESSQGLNDAQIILFSDQDFSYESELETTDSGSEFDEAIQLGFPVESKVEVIVNSETKTSQDIRLVNGKIAEVHKKPYMCTFEGCDKTYSKPVRLEYHRMVHTGEKPFKCLYSGCNKAYRRPHNLKEHAIMHGEDPRPRKCPHQGCDKAYQYQHSLDFHLRIHEFGKPFKCAFEGCSEAFAKKYQLRNHLTNHTDQKPFACDYPSCTKSYVRKQHLKNHQNTSHNVGPRFQCGRENCGREFIKHPELQAHIRQDHEPLTSCAICFKSFTKSAGLRKHIRTHDPNRIMFSCEWEGCDGYYHSLKNLNAHVQRVHQRIRPFQCDWPECEYKFTTKNEMQKHKRAIHEQSKPRQWKKIGTYNNEISLIEHFTGGNYEESGRKIGCLVKGCQYRYKREYDLQRHLKSAHPGSKNSDEEIDPKA
ncbi:hypothetical protein G9A89_001692 [Geosiphon pyriformis]|nr:hypothetical protein G9A89_001692 [Geosiphon pyriformis]